MRALLSILALGLSACSDPAPIGIIDFSKPEDRAIQLAEIALESMLAEAREMGAPTAIQALEIDLNEDGKPEILGQLHSAFHCGGNGPCLFVLTQGGDETHDLVFNVPGVNSLEIMKESVDGWHGLLLNGTAAWRWNGETYTLD